MWFLAHEFLARNLLMCKHEERITSWLTDPQKAYIHWVKLCKYRLSELFVTRGWFFIQNRYEFCLLRVVYLIHSIQYCTSTYFVSLTASLSNNHLAVGCNDVLCSPRSLSNGSKFFQIWPKDLEQACMDPNSIRNRTIYHWMVQESTHVHRVHFWKRQTLY